MSDFFRNSPSQKDPEALSHQGGSNHWEQDNPFTAYDDPAAADYYQPPSNDFSAWRKPESSPAPSFLTDAPLPYGAEMQQGGVPLYTLGADSSFLQADGDAPTRIGVPAVNPRMVSKRKTIDRGERAAFAPPPFEAGEVAVAPHKAADRSYQPPFQKSITPDAPAPDGVQPVRSRRAGRVARYQEERPAAPDSDGFSALPGPAPEARRPRPSPMSEYAPAPISAPPARDPFEADDLLADPPQGLAARRPAVPGERYTGARTAIPQSGAPIPRREIGALPDYEVDEPEYPQNRAPEARGLVPDGRPARPQGMQREPSFDDGRSPQSGRPQARRPQSGHPQSGRPQDPGRYPQDDDRRPQSGRPQDPGRYPQDDDRRPQSGRPQDPGRYPQDDDRRPQDRPQDRRPHSGRPQDRRQHFQDEEGQYSSRASIKRPRYDFEDEDDFDSRPRRGCLMPILILLLVLGLLLAGLCLPNWNAMDSGIAKALGGIKDSVIAVIDNVKNMIFPEEDRITSVAVSPAEGTAPVELVFNVQTSLSVTDLRIVDDTGNEIMRKTLTDEDLLTNEVTKNSKAMIWRLRYTLGGAYAGLYTVQAMQTDGEWDEGMPLVAPVNISEPPEVAPPVQGFVCDTTEGAVPATVGFTIQTSSDVVAVRVVDDYEMPVATYALSDEEVQGATVVESSEGLTWELEAIVNEPYEGSYRLQFQTLSDLNFIASEEGAYVELSEAVEPTTGDTDADLSAEDEMGEDGEPVIAVNAVADPDAGEEDAAVDTQPETAAEAVDQPVETEAPTAAPKATPLPKLSAEADESADPSAITLKATVYQGEKTTADYSRATAISLTDPFNYPIWEQSGVLTFRGGPLRQNAAYGTVEIANESLQEVWKVPVGSMKLSKSTVHGIVWPGQPVIVKWPTEVRNLMKLNDEKKATTALKEVILGGQDGKIYFLDLADGEPTRDPIEMGAPSAGGVAIATNGVPLLGIGQSHGNLSGKTVDNGYHLYNLLTNERLLLLSSREKAANSNYTGVYGAALFDKITGSMIVGSQNGLLYTAELGTLEDTFDHAAGSLKISNPATQRYKTLAAKQNKKTTNIDGSVAMYSNYVFYGDETGVLQCVDVNRLSPVWAVKTGDNIDATPALDFEEGAETLALYTANTIQNLGKKGVSTIRRYNGLTGELQWEYEVPDLVYAKEFKIGCVASPVIGENEITDLVIFTATNGKSGSTVIALKKSSGAVAWTTSMESESLSSPVAIYEESGKAWIIQAESNGNIHLIDAETGEIKNSLQLEGEIQGSPAVYKKMIVIGTTGKDTSYIYGIEIE